MITIPIGILWFFIILKWDVYSDHKKWMRKEPVNHSKDAIIRVLLLLPCYGLLLYPKLVDRYNVWHILIQCFIVAMLIASVWWELFDGWYNIKRGYKWRFSGTKDADDAKSDKILYLFSETERALLKFTLIACFLILYLIT